MNNALRGSLIHRALRRAQNGSIASARGDSVFKLFDAGPHGGLDHTVAQILLLRNLYALNGGLDIRQSVHPLCQNQHQLLYTLCQAFAMLKGVH